MENTNIVIVESGDSKRRLIKEIENMATSCNLSFIELKGAVENFANNSKDSADSIKELINAVTSSEFRLIDHPKERTSVIPPSFYRKRF